jgi:hypothetical protein
MWWGATWTEKEEEEEQTNQKSMHGWMDVGGRKRKRKVHSLSSI